MKVRRMLLNGLLKIGLLTLLLVAAAPLPVAADAAQADHPANHADHSGGGLNFFDFSIEGSPPLAALFLNFIVLLGIVYWLLRTPLGKQFKERKETLEKAIEEARDTQARAEATIEDARAKMDGVDQAIAKVREEILTSGKIESDHIVEEAKVRSERLLNDTKTLVEHEAHRIADTIKEEAVIAIVETAERIIREKIEMGDHERLTNDYIRTIIDKSAAAGRPGR